jgi:hypothetical protein
MYSIATVSDEHVFYTSMSKCVVGRRYKLKDIVRVIEMTGNVNVFKWWKEHIRNDYAIYIVGITLSCLKFGYRPLLDYIGSIHQFEDKTMFINLKANEIESNISLPHLNPGHGRYFYDWLNNITGMDPVFTLFIDKLF